MIHVVVPSYNNPDDLSQCLFSLSEQTHTDFSAVVIDDASTIQAHKATAREWTKRCDWTLIRNTFNCRAPFTIKQGIEASGAAPDDIIFILDGDDTLPPNALSHIASIYEGHPDTWLTYGQYTPTPPQIQHSLASEYPTLVRRERTFRQHGVTRFNHPITFRRWLWDRIDDADLQDNGGKWFTACYDYVLMMPLLEMAAPDHYVFNDEPIYVYNGANPASEWITRPHAGQQIRDQLMRRPKKDAL